MSTPVPAVTVTPPAPAPFHPLNQAVRARYLPHSPIAGTVTGSGSGGAICGSVNGAGFGSGNGSKGAPVQNPAPGPVFYQRRTPVRFILPPPHPRAGRVGSSFGAPVQNPIHGPPAYPLQGPVRARQPLPPHGRVYASRIIPAAQPTPGPVFFRAVQALRARLPLQPFLRGRSASNAGAPVRNPVPGPVFTQATSPARTRPALPPRGRVVSGKGAPVRNPAVTPPPQPRNLIRAQLPLPRRGTCRAIRFYPEPVNPPGPPSPLYPLQGPVRAQFPSLHPRAGRIGSNPGGPLANPGISPPPAQNMSQPAGIRVIFLATGRAQSTKITAATANPVPGPVFTQKTSPARIRPSLPPRGRIAAGKGAPVPAVTAGPVFYPRNQARAQLPLPRRGTCRAIRFYPAPANPQPGPPFRPATTPIRARTPLPPRGRVTSSPGAPASNPAAGPKSRQATAPARIRPSLPPRGRVSSGQGIPARNPNPGPVFRQAAHPAQARIPQVFSKGRAWSSPGGPVANPVIQPPLYPPKSPVRAHPALPPRGRISSGAGVKVLPPPPVYPLQHPVRAQFPLPPRGRTSGNPGGLGSRSRERPGGLPGQGTSPGTQAPATQGPGHPGEPRRPRPQPALRPARLPPPRPRRAREQGTGSVPQGIRVRKPGRPLRPRPARTEIPVR